VTCGTTIHTEEEKYSLQANFQEHLSVGTYLRVGCR
jgi:hypothetical protein